jgi:hypothetical protein
MPRHWPIYPTRQCTKRNDYNQRHFNSAIFARPCGSNLTLRSLVIAGAGMPDEIMAGENARLRGYSPWNESRPREVEPLANDVIMERYAYAGEGDTCLILTDGYENKETPHAK